jgi:hypothetical protein
MHKSGLGAATPYPVPRLATPRVLVMTRLFGYRVCTLLVLLYVCRRAQLNVIIPLFVL